MEFIATGVVQPGDPAPDFKLPASSGGEADGRSGWGAYHYKESLIMVILKMPIVTMGFIYHLIGESHENDGNPIHDGGKATPL